jgi:hypothetical protein
MFAEFSWFITISGKDLLRKKIYKLNTKSNMKTKLIRTQLKSFALHSKQPNVINQHYNIKIFWTNYIYLIVYSVSIK